MLGDSLYLPFFNLKRYLKCDCIFLFVLMKGWFSLNHLVASGLEPDTA